MGRKPSGDAQALQAALQQIKSERDAESLRGAQAVLLPLLGLSLGQTAQVVGRDRYWVSRARNRRMRGEATQVRHGGRRHAIVPDDEEIALVKRAIRQAKPPRATRGFVSLRDAVRQLLDQAAGRPVSEATVTALLKRTAPRIVAGATGAMMERLSFHLQQMWFHEECVASIVAEDRE